MIRTALSIALFLGIRLPVIAQDDPDRLESAKEATALTKRGASIIRDEKRPGSPVVGVVLEAQAKNANLELLTAFPHLERLWLRYGNAPDADFSQLAKLSKLRYLDIQHGAITENAFAQIALIPQLIDLSISSAIEESGLAQLARSQHLERLRLRGSTITDVGLAHLGRTNSTSLRSIELGPSQATAAGIAGLKDALPYAIIDTYGGRRIPNYFSEYLNRAGIMALFGVLLAILLRWRLTFVRKRPVIWKSIVVATAVAIMSVGLVRFARVMYPVLDGDAGQFWIHVCRIDVGAEHPRWPWGGFYLPRDGKFIYYSQDFHGQTLYQVPASECEALFPKLFTKLRHAPPGVLSADVKQGFRVWSQSSPDPNDADAFVAKVREARLNRLRSSDAKQYEYSVSVDEYFDERWTRIQRYHWNIRFEFAFLTAVVLFAAWPWLRNCGRVRWAFHLGLLPVLFFLPYWLGYAVLTFTSAGPSGGVLYPWLIVPFRGLPWSELDTMILRSIPHPLERLSQTPGPMMSLSGMDGVGPVSMIVLASIIFAAILWGPRAAHWSQGEFKKWLAARRPPQ